MFFTTIALVTATSLLIWYYLWPSEYHRKLATIPGPRGIPIFGNALQIPSKSSEFFSKIKELSHEYSPSSPVFKIFYGNRALVYTMCAESVEECLGTMKNIAKPWTYRMMEPWVRTGLVTSSGKKWHTRRKLLTPTFHFRILKDFLSVINAHAEVFVELLSGKCGEDAFDVSQLSALCTLDVICETAMGRTVHAQNTGCNSEYVTAINGITDMISQRIKCPWMWNDFIYNKTPTGKKHAKYLSIIHGFTQQVINERRQEIEKDPNTNPGDADMGPAKSPMPFLDLLLHMAKEADLSDDDIQEEVDTFMAAGHDTTATGISWILHALGSHLDIQRQLQQELDAIFGDSDRGPTMEDLSKMKYLECIIKESLRMFPPIPLVSRHVNEEIQLGDKVIPKGAVLCVIIWKIHRDPKHWINPDQFDPERFTTENSVGRHPYSFLPFSAGPRNCIGQRFAMMEMKGIISAILRKLNIKSVQTAEEIGFSSQLLLRPINGIKIRVIKRVP